MGRAWAAVKYHALTFYAACAFIYLLLPIAVVIAFSFNDPAGRFNYTWQGFTLDNWKNWDAVPGLVIPVWFHASESRTYALLCAELCGWGHYKMKARFVAEPAEDWVQWLRDLHEAQNFDGVEAPAEQAPAE